MTDATEAGSDYSADPSLPATGTKNYRAYVGFPEAYDVASTMQFSLLAALGLRDTHKVLDIGCGSLRLGRLLIPYLRAGGYAGLEPNKWLVDEGFANELGRDIIALKKPVFEHRDDYGMAGFDRKFDYMVAQSIFSHAPESQIRQCFTQAVQYLAPEGMFAATFMPGEENYSGSDWVYPSCVEYTLGHMQALADETGLCLRPMDWLHGNSQQWTLITHKGFEPPLPERGNLELVGQLQHTISAQKNLYARLENHPYVRFGMSIRKKIRKITGK